MVIPTLRVTLLDKNLKGTSGGAAGYYKGFPIVIDYFDTNDEFTIQINATSSNDPLNKQLEAYWQQQKLSIPELLLVTVEPHSFVFTVKTGIWANVKTEFLNSFIDKIMNYLIQNGYEPCCKTCGSTLKPISCYVTNGKTDFMCNDCHQELVASLEKKKSDFLAEKANFPLGFLGAFIGAS